MKIPTPIQKQQVEALGLRFYEPRWLKMPWQSDDERPVDVTEVASALNEGKTGLKVQLGEERWPVANAADFRALAQLQKSAQPDPEAPTLSRQLSDLMTAGFTVSGMAAYPAYLSLRAGESVEVENSRGLPVARLEGQDLESQAAAAVQRQEQLEKALSSGEAGLVSLALFDQSQHSSRTFQDLDKSIPAQRFFERTQALGPEQQREWFALASQAVQTVPFADRVELLTSLGLTQRAPDGQAQSVLQAAAWIRRSDEKAPLIAPLQKIQRQAGEKFVQSLSSLAQLPAGEDWSGVGVFASGPCERPLAQRAALYRQAAVGRLEETLQPEAFAKIATSGQAESWALLNHNIGSLKAPLQRPAWQTFSAQPPAQALWGSAFAAASQDVDWASGQVWTASLPSAGMLSDLRKFKIPSSFPARQALAQTLQELLLQGRFLSSFGPALNRLVERIGQEKISPETAQEMLQSFHQLSSSGQTALGEKNQDLPQALKAEGRKRSRAWDRALVEEPLRMTAWAQVGAARQLGMHGGPGLQGEPGMAEPTMKLFRILANADKTCEQATLQVQGLLHHLEQIGVAEVDLATAYLESYQKLTSLGRAPEATLRSLDETLKQLEPSEKFRDKPGPCLTDAVELGLLCPSPSETAIEIQETKEAVVIGGIRLQKKKPLA